MPLTLRTHAVTDTRLADASGFADGQLALDPRALEARLRERDPRIAKLGIHLASPGDATRVVCCKDVVQPRVKLSGDTPGSGVLAVLEGIAVVTCGPIVGFQEGIIDMSGPGARYTPFSRLHLVVLEITPASGTSPHDHEAVLRRAGLEAAAYLGDLCREAAPQQSREILWNERPVDEGLPRVAYVCMALTQGLLHDTYLLGENAVNLLPRTLDPRILIDTGLTSGNCVSACDKNTTYHHQNNPLLQLLLDGHGERWNFAGLVLTKSPVRLADKQSAAEQAVALTRALDVAGAVISKEGFGNPDADLMMIVRGLEASGIRTVGLTDEFAGVDGASQSIADSAVEADAIVSTGNANARIRLPALRRVIGPLPDVGRLAGGYSASLHDDGSLEVELQAVMGATNELGFSYLSCREV